MGENDRLPLRCSFSSRRLQLNDQEYLSIHQLEKGSLWVFLDLVSPRILAERVGQDNLHKLHHQELELRDRGGRHEGPVL